MVNMKPQIFAATTLNVFTSPSHQRPPLCCGHNFFAKRVALFMLLERDLLLDNLDAHVSNLKECNVFFEAGNIVHLVVQQFD